MLVEEDMDPRYSPRMLLEEEDDTFDISIDVYGRPLGCDLDHHATTDCTDMGDSTKVVNFEAIRDKVVRRLFKGNPLDRRLEKDPGWRRACLKTNAAAIAKETGLTTTDIQREYVLKIPLYQPEPFITEIGRSFQEGWYEKYSTFLE